jgi:rhomboid protease GluP
MPKFEQTIPLTGLDKETALAICYQAFQDLGWPVLYAGEEKILGQTIKLWNSYPQQIIVGINGLELNISSEMNKGQMMDLGGKNKKNTKTFFAAFDAARTTLQEEKIQDNKNTLAALRTKTAEAAEQQQKEAEEVEKAMNLNGSNLYVTYTLIGINVLVFILMAIDGAGIMDTNAVVHLKWGSDYAPLTLTGDWWRVFTCMFIHFGIIHLAMNMYCLYYIGTFLEPMLGKVKYISAYLCTGVLSSIASLWWHKEAVNSAGASGAIFGMYGLFLALLTTNLIPKTVRQGLLQNIGIFVVYNLVYGTKGGVDNAAHIGGLLSGFVFGYLFVIGIKKGKEGQQVKWVLPVIIAATIAIAGLYLNSNKLSTEERSQALNMIENTKHKDTERYNASMQQVGQLEDSALAPLNDTTALFDQAFKTKLENISLPLYQKMEDKLKEIDQYDIAANLHTKIKDLITYVAIKQQELDIYIKMCEAGSSEQLTPELDKIKEREVEITKKLQSDN